MIPGSFQTVRRVREAWKWGKMCSVSVPFVRVGTQIHPHIGPTSGEERLKYSPPTSNPTPWSFKLASIQSRNFKIEWTAAKRSLVKAYITTYRGTQREILRERPKNNNKAWIKFSESILSTLGDCWKKIICSSLPARLMEEFPASKLTTCNLTYWEVS